MHSLKLLFPKIFQLAISLLRKHHETVLAVFLPQEPTELHQMMWFIPSALSLVLCGCGDCSEGKPGNS